MISDKYIALTRRAVTTTTGNDGITTETTTDSTFYGFIAEMRGTERFSTNQTVITIDGVLFTDATLSSTDRVVDGSDVFEIDFVHKSGTRYDLKRIR